MGGKLLISCLLSPTPLRPRPSGEMPLCDFLTRPQFMGSYLILYFLFCLTSLFCQPKSILIICLTKLGFTLLGYLYILERIGQYSNWHLPQSPSSKYNQYSMISRCLSRPGPGHGAPIIIEYANNKRRERERYKTQMPIINNTSPTSRPDIKHSLIQEGSPFYNCTHPAAKFSRIPRFTIYFPLPCLDFFGASFAIFRRDNQYSCLLFKLSCNNHQSQGHNFADC